MTLLSSLRGRVFLASALLAVLSIGVAIYLVNVRVTREAEHELQREILATGAIFDKLRTDRTQTFTLEARLIANLPHLKAAVDTDDPPTVQGFANDYDKQLNWTLLLVTNKSGHVLATVGASPSEAAIVAGQPAIHDALSGHERVSLLPQQTAILQLITVPISIRKSDPEILGTLSVGFLLDDALADQLKEITGSDIAFGMNGQVLASTLTEGHEASLTDVLRRTDVSPVWLGPQEFMALPRPLSSNGDQKAAGSGPVALILRSRTQQLRFLQAIHTGLAVTAVVALSLAMLLSFAVARTITRPLATITDAMRDVAATGDLTRKIVLRQNRRWDDEDARLLATTFNTLTDSIARFQREMSQKERLSSLGRLSTVIAHEVRNPLMIIKASLHGLRQPDVSAASLREAVADIDEEVARLNRIVNEVLDFARPIHFECVPVDLNALCRESSGAAQAADRGERAEGSPHGPVRLELNPAIPTVTTDPERLRIALVNMLVNAKHAVAAAEPAVVTAGSPVAPSVTLTTHADGDRVKIVIADRGIGIDVEDIPRVFDPYFTTKRGGTGLGLPIAKNIVEGLGGTLAVASAAGAGTEIRIDLPIVAVVDPLPSGSRFAGRSESLDRRTTQDRRASMTAAR